MVCSSVDSMLLLEDGLQYHRGVAKQKHVDVDEFVLELRLLKTEVLKVLFLRLDLFACHLERLHQLFVSQFLDANHIDDHGVRRQLLLAVDLELEASLRESLAEGGCGFVVWSRGVF